MTKFILKLLIPILRIIAILLTVLVALIFAIGLLVNLNNYKVQLSSFISKSIGYDLKINGSLQWSLGSDLVFFAQNVTLNNLKTNQFPEKVLTAREVAIAVNPFYSLFKAKLVISSVTFDVTNFYFFKNEQQKTNIDELWHRINFIIKNTKIKENLIINKVIFKGANFYIEDQIKKSNIGINQINATLNNELRDVAFDLKSATMDLNLDKEQPLKKQLSLEGKGMINFNSRSLNITYGKIEHQEIKYIVTSNISYEDQKIIADGSVLLQPIHDINNIKEVSLKIKFAVNGSQVDLNNILLTLDDGTVTGKANVISANNNNNGNFALKIQGIEIPKVIRVFKDIGYSEDFLFLSSLLKKLQLNGNIRGNSIYVNPSLVIDNLDLPIASSTPGVFELHRGLFNLAKAMFSVNLKLEFAPKFILDFYVDARDVDIQSISRALMSGLGKINIQLAAMTDNCSVQEILQKLEGKIDIDINNGTLQGVDLFNTLNQYEQNLEYLYSMLQMNNKQDVNVLLANSKKTVQNVFGAQAVSVFSDLRFLAVIKAGIADNAEIFLKHPQYLAKGYGIINLPKNDINYNINAKLIKPPSDFQQVSQYMQAAPLLINVTGSLQNINFAVDTQNYLLEGLKELQKNLLSVKKIIPEQLEEYDKLISKPIE